MNRRIGLLLSELNSRGVLTAREMQLVIGGSAAMLSRLLAGSDARRIIRFGKARATRYALRRDVRGLGSEWPLYRVKEDGSASLEGCLYALNGGRWLLQQESSWDSLRGDCFKEGLYLGLPWFLQDMRPAGFLGRLVAQRYSVELGMSPDPRDWSDDDILQFLVVHGGELPGAFLVGRMALAAAQAEALQHADLVPESERAVVYPQLAAATMAGALPGSSAAGEQPKFTARLRRSDGTVDSVIVKFSGSGGRPEDQRWSDLLAAEHIANGVLSGAGILCAVTKLLHANGRCFLESSRFDRVGLSGRKGFVSLEAFDGAHFGEVGTPWDLAAIRYREHGWITEPDAERLALLWWFGVLIGNTDMHYANAGLILGESRPLALAPVYDMVPMFYRPDIEGRLPAAPVVPVPPPPESRIIWLSAAALARAYWERLANSELVSQDFREIALKNLESISNVAG